MHKIILGSIQVLPLRTPLYQAVVTIPKTLNLTPVFIFFGIIDIVNNTREIISEISKKQHQHMK